MLLTILRLTAVYLNRGIPVLPYIYVLPKDCGRSQYLWMVAIFGWPANEVPALLTALISGKRDEEIRKLPISLEAERKALA